MRKLALFATVVCLISSYCMNAQGQTLVRAWESHFVGPSASKTTGNAHGTVGMNQLCQAAFGATAHMCTVDEFFHTAGFAKSSAGAPLMWVQPSFHDCVFDTKQGQVTCQLAEVGRVVESANMGSCLHWTTGINTLAGMVVVTNLSSPTPTGALVTANNCANPVFVACCAP